MAAHGNPEYSVAEGNDYVAHEQTYLTFISLVKWGLFNTIFEQKEYFESYSMEPIAEKMLKERPELKAEFEKRLNSPGFADNPRARLQFFFDRSPVYLTVGALVGGGAIALERDHDSGVGDVSDGDRNSHDLFAIIQPDVALNANLTHWMRVGVTAGYRFASGANRLGFDNGDLNCFMVGGQLQFGRF